MIEKTYEELKNENEKLKRDLEQKDKALYELTDFFHNIRDYNLNNIDILNKITHISINLRNCYTKGGIMRDSEYSNIVKTNEELLNFVTEIYNSSPEKGYYTIFK